MTLSSISPLSKPHYKRLEPNRLIHDPRLVNIKVDSNRSQDRKNYFNHDEFDKAVQSSVTIKGPT